MREGQEDSFKTSVERQFNTHSSGSRLTKPVDFKQNFKWLVSGRKSIVFTIEVIRTNPLTMLLNTVKFAAKREA